MSTDYTSTTLFFEKILVVSRVKGKIVNNMVQKFDHATEKYAGCENRNLAESLSIFQDAVS